MFSRVAFVSSIVIAASPIALPASVPVPPPAAHVLSASQIVLAVPADPQHIVADDAQAWDATMVRACVRVGQRMTC